ncbi:hypothetical protein P154DRAFT_580797 [Amniculicola lignicola CBS 123094]|uniref:Uncharacterized protein n=1 Tax=Amniculicola lignicola CBS 123094 TaxID=1392246 RepID=A0A6A5W1B4_9PLEO|nr:hypothetical protein P154DRAFT_580797 [Amniculicola lignicola CBS 123094]
MSMNLQAVGAAIGGIIPLIMNRTRKTWTLVGLAVVGIPLIAAWAWEVARTRNHNRHSPPTHLTDWSNDAFVAILFLSMLNRIASSLWQYIILWFLGCFSNLLRKAVNYAGVLRGCLGAGEAICFGVDSIAVPYMKEAAMIFAFYIAGVFIFLYLALFHISNTEYFSHEEGVVIPNHMLAEASVEGIIPDSNVSESTSVRAEQVSASEKTTEKV